MPFFVWFAALLEGLTLTLIQGFLPLYVRRTLGEAHFLTVGLVVAVPAVARCSRATSGAGSPT